MPLPAKKSATAAAASGAATKANFPIARPNTLRREPNLANAGPIFVSGENIFPNFPSFPPPTGKGTAEAATAAVVAAVVVAVLAGVAPITFDASIAALIFLIPSEY